MLKRGRYCLMNACSASSASASLSTTTLSIDATSAIIVALPPAPKCDATRLRTDTALPT